MANGVGAHKDKQNQPPGHRWEVGILGEEPRTDNQDPITATLEEQAGYAGKWGGA